MQDTAYFIHFATKPVKDKNDRLFYQYLTVQKMPLRQAEHKREILSDIRNVSQKAREEIPLANRTSGEGKDVYASRRMQINHERGKLLNHRVKGLAMRYSQISGLRELYTVRCDAPQTRDNYVSGQIVLELPKDAKPFVDSIEESELEDMARTA